MNLEDWPILKDLKPYFFKTVRLALVFGDCGSEALLLTRDNCVYAIGKNLSGCLGLGDTLPRSTLTQVPALSGKNIEDLAYGGNYTCENTPDLFVVARSSDGRVYQWGHIPNTSPENCLLEPYLVKNLKYKVVEISCGIAHCMARCDNGQVYSWGDNSKSQLGRVSELEGEDDVVKNFTAYRVQDLDGRFVVQISCGAYFSVAVMDDGEVMSWGRNDHGQIGVGYEYDTERYSPTTVRVLKNVPIKKVACGYAHVFALTETGAAYAWGKCYHRRMTDNSYKTYFDEPVKVGSVADCPGSLFSDIESNYSFNISAFQIKNHQVVVGGDVTPELRLTKFLSVKQAFLRCLSTMNKPLRLVKQRRTIVETMENAFEYPEHSDLTVVVEDKKICVHKVILSLRSKYFETILARWVDTDENVITIKDKKYDVMNAYLQYIYSDKLRVNLDLAVDLLMLADEYGDDDFKVLCEKNIEDNMSMDMVSEIYTITKTIKNTEDLSAFCINFAMRHPEVVISSKGFKNWDAATTKTFLADYVKRKEYDIRLRNDIISNNSPSVLI